MDVENLEVHVELLTGEVLVGVITDEDDEHIFLKWSNQEKLSMLAKNTIRAVRFTEIELY